MKTGNFRKFLLLAVLIAITTTMGCRATRDVYEVGSLAADSLTDMILPDPKPLLKKKILVVPVINKAEIDSSLADEINNRCIYNLNLNEYLSVSSINKWDDEAPGSLLERYGTVLNPEHLKSAEKMGVNLILGVIINPIEITEKRRGMWPVRKDTHNVLISVSIHALDTMNGALIINENITKNINGGKVNSSETKKWKPDKDVLNKKIFSYIEELCSKVTKDLQAKPWKSKVYTDGDNLVLRAGRDIGINKNTVFMLYRKGDPIMSYTGEKYYVFGERIGEVGVKSVSEDKTVLAVSGEGKFKDAAFVSIIRNDD